MKRFIAFFFVVLMASCGSMQTPNTNQDSRDFSPADNQDRVVKNTRIVIFDVGQGDAIFLEPPSGEGVLIDVGSAGSGTGVILPFLKHEGINKIGRIIVTHYHEDHLGALSEVLAGFDGTHGTADDFIPGGGIYDRGEPAGDSETATFQVYAAETYGRRNTLDPGDIIDLGDCHVEVVAANGELADGTRVELGIEPDENSASITLLIVCGSFKMFIAGDLTGGGGNPPYETLDVETPLGPLVGDINILKVAHHGSNSSTNESFLNATTPEIAIISVGDGNDFFHPHQSVTERLIEHGITVYQTERGWQKNDTVRVLNGDVFIEVDEKGNYFLDEKQQY